MSAEPPPRLERIPREIACATDYEAFARARLDDNAWAYLAGAAGDQRFGQWARFAHDGRDFLAYESRT